MIRFNLVPILDLWVVGRNVWTMARPTYSALILLSRASTFIATCRRALVNQMSMPISENRQGELGILRDSCMDQHGIHSSAGEAHSYCGTPLEVKILQTARIGSSFRCRLTCIKAASSRACLSKARSSKAWTASSKSAAGAVSNEVENPMTIRISR